MANRNPTISNLIISFKENGLYVSQSWIRRQEDKGNLILPRSTTNFKIAQGARRSGAVRYLSSELIMEIVKAFLPEGTKLKNGEFATGKGYFNYKKYELDSRPSIPTATAL